MKSAEPGQRLARTFACALCLSLASVPIPGGDPAAQEPTGTVREDSSLQPADASPAGAAGAPAASVAPVAPAADAVAPTPAGDAAVAALTLAIERIVSIEQALAAGAGTLDPAALDAGLKDARMALLAALVEVGRLRQDEDLRAWLVAEGVVRPEPRAEAGEGGPAPQPQGIGPERLRQVVAAIQSISFAAGKMQVLTRELAGERVTSQQASALLELFSFSRDRVDALVFLHPRIVDQENFDGLLAALKFESDRETVRSRLGLGG